ncbi:hypothetical protein PARMER_01230 [Parabacteroides merdae ATCC 43184]|nr:hypothetical protein PARMER_01230 [Parabacteroides merdae ATCC 43184]
MYNNGGPNCRDRPYFSISSFKYTASFSIIRSVGV